MRRGIFDYRVRVCFFTGFLFLAFTCRSGTLFRDLVAGLTEVDLVRDRLSNSCSLLLVRHCRSRTAGEALFCYSPKECPEKAATSATPLKSRGTHLVGSVIML